MEYLLASFTAYALIIAVIVIIVLLVKQKKRYKHIAINKTIEETIDEEQENTKKYTYVKKCLMTEIEKKFFDAFKSSISEEYLVFPQVNLATIIRKQGDFKYQNELFRNIDFCIFDKFYNPLLLIEINDESHNEYQRKQRDDRVKRISDIADIPLIKFYTKYGVNQEYITKRIQENLEPSKEQS